MVYFYSMYKLIIKLFSPILYFGFVISTLLIFFFTMMLAANVASLFDFGFIGKTSASFIRLTSILLVLFIFGLANKVSTELEKLVQPTTVDHLRQSAILYAIILATFLKTVFFNEYHLGLNIWPAWAIIYLSLVAIIINAFYLFWTSRRPLTTCQSSVTSKIVKPSSTKIGMSIFVGPTLISLLMAIGYYVRQMHYQIEYLKINPPPVASPNDPMPPADSQSLTDELSTSTYSIPVNRDAN